MPYADPADHRAQTSRWAKANPDKRYAMEKAYKQRPDVREKSQARNRLRYALRTGAVVAQPCEMCGAEPAHAHHPFGYAGAMALAVWWLCRPHHDGLHAALKGR